MINIQARFRDAINLLYDLHELMPSKEPMLSFEEHRVDLDVPVGRETQKFVGHPISSVGEGAETCKNLGPFIDTILRGVRKSVISCEVVLWQSVVLGICLR
jgi:hypothetical protein